MATDLTEAVYTNLKRRRVQEAELFGFIYSKLLTRQVRLGGSPFGRLNVEDVYDALRRYLDRSADSLSEFVNSWDEGLSAEQFKAEDFRRALRDLVNKSIAASKNSSRISFEESLYSSVSKPIELAFSRYKIRDRFGDPLQPYIDALVNCLNPSIDDPQYISDFIDFSVDNIDIIATLNYDLICETACDRLNLSYTYGLEKWNQNKLVQLDPAKIRLLKLHGSVNWMEQGDDVIIENKPKAYMKRALIFGGQSQKLVPHGPYLQLRSLLERRMRASDKIAVVGYSFQDAHINAMLRLWLATKRKGKMIILNPSLPHNALNQLGRWFDINDKGKISRNRIEMVHIKKSAKIGMGDLLKELITSPNTTPVSESPLGVRIVE